MSKVYNAIKDERTYQTNKWGTKFDDQNNAFNWAAYITQYATRHLIGDPNQSNVNDFRTDMIKVAALAVAAIESIDRKAGV